MFGLTAAVLLIMTFVRHWEVFSPKCLCVALLLSTERRPGQWYGVTLFAGVDLILFVFISVGQGIIYHTVKEKGRRTRKHSNPFCQIRHNQRVQEFNIARKLSLIFFLGF